MNSIYVQGFSTSMPHDIQEQMIRTLPGLENCTILKYAYAIEYDAIDPLQLWPSLETKVIKNLFTALIYITKYDIDIENPPSTSLV